MPNLLQKASIVLTPTAYDNGKVLCAKPSEAPYGDFDFSRNSAATRVNSQGLVEDVQILSSNLVQNGDFATNSDWSMQASWSIANGKASYNGAGNGHYIKQNASLTIGSQYIAKLDILDSSGNFRISVDGGTASYNNYTTGNGTYSFTFVASSSEFFVRASMGFSSDTLSIDNVSVIEITDDTNLPRINYEGGCGSWLFEPQSTNLITYSEDFSQWNKGNDLSILNGFLAPDGNSTAYKVTKTGTSQPYLTFNAGLIQTTTRSIYARSVSGTGTATLLSHNSNTNNVFTLTEEWQRFEVSDTASSSGRSSFYAADFRGSGTLTEYLVWGANATNDQDYATSYIPSNGTSVTRNSDVCNNGGSLASINSTEGVLYVEVAALANDATTRRISITDGSISNRVSLEFDEISNRIVAFITSNGVSQILIYNTPNLLQFNKIALKYKENDFAIWFNGAEVATDLFGSVPIGLNEISFEAGNGNGIFFGKTKCLAVWKEALSDEELTLLTAPAPVAPTFTLDFDEIANQFTFSRASVGSIVNEQGLIETDIQNNIPRIDYSTGTEAFLLEPQSTNLFPYSNDFTQYNNVGGRFNITQNAVTSPDGTLNATKIEKNTPSSTARIRSAGVNVVGVQYTSSVYAKKGNSDQMKIITGGVQQDFTLTEEWVRYELTATATNTFSDIAAISGGTTGDFIYIFGAQLEEINYATSYIPTSGTTVTRVGETCVNATPEINSEEGALYFEGRTLANGAGVRSISLSDGTTQQRILIRYSSAENQLSLYCIKDGNLSAIVGTNSYNLLEFNKIAISYKQNNFKFFVNGTKIGEDNSGSTPTLLNKLSFNGGSGENFYGNTKDVQVFTEALSDYQLAQLTTI